MDFSFSEEQEAFRKEVRAFVKGKIPEELKFGFLRKTDLFEDDYRPFFQELGRKGWLCVHWPEEYGGLGRSLIESGILLEELGLAGAPRPNIGMSFVGSCLLTYGTEKLKKEFLPGIAKGEIYFSEGLSEPNAGSDLGSLTTRAYPVEDGYIIDGQKLFTTNAHKWEHCFLLARTDPELPKHKGLSLFAVDLRTPGITRRQYADFLGGYHFNEVFYDKVKIPKDRLIGEENNGWYEVMFALNTERIFFGGGTFCAGACRGIINEVMPYLDGSKGGKEGKSFAYPNLRSRLAELWIETEISRWMAYQSIWKYIRTSDVALDVSISKVFTTELVQRVVDLAMKVLGMYGQLFGGSKMAPIHGLIPVLSLGSVGETIGAGTSEIQRTIIARRLGLPR